MKRKLLPLSYVAAGALALAIPAAKATPLASSLRFDSGVAQAHAMRICDDDGDCWWSDRHRHRGDWEDRDRGWRHGYRDDDDRYGDHYGRAPHHHDWSDRDDDRDHERHGRKWDKDHERGEWGRSAERERHDMDDQDRDKDYRRDKDAKERGETGEKK